MRVTLDESLCQAYGNCLLAAPEVFDLDASSAVATVLQPGPPESLRPEVEEAVRSCPVEALRLLKD
jgi:ferredoxin